DARSPATVPERRLRGRAGLRRPPGARLGFDEQLGLDFNVDQVVYVFVHTADRWCFWRRIDPAKKPSAPR
ncbi:hypothetical protein, partial [Rhodothermus marinus]|uniref:hypothetical protein n=1 Tax=Rhodothermus marinus TaxID=29549 RepID=UPI001FB4F6A0